MILIGDVMERMKEIPDSSIYTCVTSPPYYGLRDYDMDGQIGLEDSPEEYVGKLLDVFREVHRVLKDDGTLWLNLGDTFYGSWGNFGGQNRGTGTQRTIDAGSYDRHEDQKFQATDKRPPQSYKHPILKPKDLIGIPWRVAFALQADGWYLRSDIIWHKPNAMPESVRDRPSKAHEYIFLLSKSEKYYYDYEGIKEPAIKGNAGSTFTKGKTAQHQMNRASLKVRGESGKRNKRSVWTVSTKPFKEAHFATFPVDLIEPCIIAGCPKGETVLDPFFGSGTTGIVAEKNARKYIGIELNPQYAEIAQREIVSSERLTARVKPSKRIQISKQATLF